MADPHYYARYDGALRRMATAEGAGRLEASSPVRVVDDTGEELPVGTPFQLMGPGDVEGLAPGAIVRRHPAPGTGDAEARTGPGAAKAGKVALVEFAVPDLPWRYTPQRPVGERLSPWLVLVVGEPGTEGVSVRPDGTVAIHPQVLQLHPLEDSWHWAHVHRVDGFERSRLVSPVPLATSRRYVAALVPSFAFDGAPAWTGGTGAPVTLPCYDSWEFSTGSEGSFLALASQLTRADAGELARRAGGRPFGRADLGYRHRSSGASSTLSAAGALRTPSEVTPDPADVPPPPEVAADVAALQTALTVPDGRDVLTAPDYPRSFVGRDTATGSDGWAVQLTEDPRLRGAAGLGAWNAIAWQGKISDAAAVKLGDALIAAERIRALAFGVAVSRSLWRRHVPADSVRRLVVLAPALGKLPTTSGGPVRNHLGGRTAQFGPMLLSLAARRALRAGTARSRLAEPGAHDLPGLLALAVACPDRTDPPDLLEAPEPEPSDPTTAVHEALHAATDDPELAEELSQLMPEDENARATWLAAVLTAMAPGPDGPVDPDVVRRTATQSEGHPDLDGALVTWAEEPDDHAPPCRPLEVGRLGEVVGAAVDPTVETPPAALRVYATMPGVRSMRPLLVEPELDLPLWSFLSTASPDWMLPGVGDLAEHEVVGVETNPGFVRALLVGANHQAAAELRWRNVPLVPRSSPLRRFWQRVRDPAGPAGADTGLDIRPVRSWPPHARLDDASLAPGDLGSEAVVVFRSPIFRRFPSTVVYLYAADPDWVPPPAAAALQKAKRVEPTFTGTIGTDVTFFGFPVPPTALRSHWVVLEEPPPGYTFYDADQPGAGPTAAHAGGYAKRRLALPVRVLIGPLL